MLQKEKRKKTYPKLSRMYRVSSNSTVFFKLFIPTVWFVFFSTFTASLFLASDEQLPFLTSPVFKYPFLAAFLIIFALLYFTLMSLKRVELGDEAYIVTNYLKAYRLIYDDIEKITIIPLFRLQIVIFRLRAKSSFGKKIVFLASKFLYDHFMQTHPAVASKLAEKTNK